MFIFSAVEINPDYFGKKIIKCNISSNNSLEINVFGMHEETPRVAQFVPPFTQLTERILENHT